MANPNPFQNFHVTVKGIVVLNNKFLVVTEPHGVTELPGGRVDQKEKIEDVLIRELREEIGLDLNQMKYNVSLANVDQRYDYHFYDEEGTCLLGVFYKVEIQEEIEIKLSEEHETYEWIDKTTDLKKFNFKNKVQEKMFYDLQKTICN